MDTYKYKAPPSASTRNFKPLPESDYDFEIVRCTEPYKNTKDNWVLPVRLSILPERITVFANPWSGVDKNGEPRDTIAEFLICVGRAPGADQEPDWDSIIGAHGRCHLKVQTAKQGKLAGQEVNVVAWFIEPGPIVPTGQRRNRSSQELAKLRLDQPAAAGEPDDLPF